MTHETLESLLALVCKSVTVSQQNTQQTLYTLGDTKDARLAYDLLATCNMEVKFFTENDYGKLYVQNASVARSEARLGAILVSAAPVAKQIKDLLDSQQSLNYNLSLTTTPSGRQLTIVFPSEKLTTQSAATQLQQPAVNAEYRIPRKASETPIKEDNMAAGPEVARKAIPKSFKTNESGEDPLHKRLLLYISGRAFSSTAWMVFIAIIFGVIFSVVVMMKGFLCPDVATDSRTIPSYCPQKNVVRVRQ